MHSFHRAQCGQKRTACRSFPLLFTLYIHTALVYLRTAEVLQYSENEASLTTLLKAARMSESSQGHWRKKRRNILSLNRVAIAKQQAPQLLWFSDK